ncbi:chromosome segregation in meiosis- protein [Purpureocillium takamizusanense]|uniref:Chromosome segregation in meiosis protein n=1 Tax=Purpureocillium takamizusanense TaxID=2060973 RepID=A0A9Q8QMA9_9HYPO|nr:chromosome segregation in meiosis- protein [Purpureocillium takamizusanense]UNI22345.1 chromosome segregation in meiosis- protein [Purpureocillium takamizusanense]
MPSAVTAGQKPTHDDLDNYAVNDLSDDPFASPSPQSKKRKEPASSSNALGIDEEVSVQKRARVPAVKLDEDRLLGPAGIPRLRQRASRSLKIKGKGHEFSDAARLLSFYQLWLDDLFPKARFLDALAMVEKAGHKKRVMTARNEWINEGRPKSGADEDEYEARDNGHDDATVDVEHGTDATAGGLERPQTPLQDVPGDDDLYAATPRARTATRRDVPEDDDLDALIAEAEGQDLPSNKTRQSHTEPDEDDLDALIAEAEGQDAAASSNTKSASTGDGDEFADEEAAMLEMGSP